MTRQRKSQMEKLIKRYRTQQTNLKARRADLVAAFEGGVRIIDADLSDIDEILSRLEAKK